MIKVGILFGGPSREREIAFAGGRTVYDNLNKSLFIPVPIFIDSFKNLILLDWQFIYKGSIRDFYPPIAHQPESSNHFQIYTESIEQEEKKTKEMIDEIGKPISFNELGNLIDIAFLALHGQWGEDGEIQGMLESLNIPYTGSGVRACAIGMDKSFQKKLMEVAGFNCPKVQIITRQSFLASKTQSFYESALKEIGLPFVIRPANQGSSIGVSICYQDCSEIEFTEALNNAFFTKVIPKNQWISKSVDDKIEYIRQISDIRSGLGFPLLANGIEIIHPDQLLVQLDRSFQEDEEVFLEAHWSEQRVIIEAFIEGREFSCVVIEGEKGELIALPPTGIIKGKELFDYRSKYLPGLSRKETPISLSSDRIESIRAACTELYQFLGFNTYARIDGFIQDDGTIFLNDPNTTSGMLPSSFFFHQAAEIGLNPSQFLTYLIRTSINCRINESLNYSKAIGLLSRLDSAIEALKTKGSTKKKIGVILGGYSFERHISVESGRNIFEKLASSEKYKPIPIFLSGNKNEYYFHQLPINLLLKDNADDIRKNIEQFSTHELIHQIRNEASKIINKYTDLDHIFEPQPMSYAQLAEEVDGLFIALHGRPGEDGTIQIQLEKMGIPYNGSNPASSQITINKYDTAQLLRKNKISTADQLIVTKNEYLSNLESLLDRIENSYSYPFIIKPVDDGCSSAVKLIRDQDTLRVYLKLVFRNDPTIDGADRSRLGLEWNEEFPAKSEALIENLISKEGADQFLEITCGLLTHHKEDEVIYEIFEPSETLVSGDILSLEEKFLAGEGLNITPARFGKNLTEYKYIAQQVKDDIEKTARAAQVTGYARIDAFVRIDKDLKVETIIIEINSLPGMTPATCIFHQTAINGYKPFDFIDKILDFGFHERDRRTVREQV